MLNNMLLAYFKLKISLFLDAFANLGKTTFSFVLSVCLSVRPSVRIEQLGSHWTDFHENRYFNIFRKSVAKFQLSSNSGKNNGYFT